MSNMVPFNELEKMAEYIAKSGLFGMKTKDQAMALMLIAQAEGQHPATITQDYDIIKGRSARKTNSVLARYQSAGGTLKWHELTATRAAATFTHPASDAVDMDWTFEQASKVTVGTDDSGKQTFLTYKEVWRNYPRAMLRARCIAEGVRASYPAAIGGMLVTEEAQDLPEHEIVGGSTDAAPPKPAIEMPKPKAVAAIANEPGERLQAVEQREPVTIEQEKPVTIEQRQPTGAPVPMSDTQIRILNAKAGNNALPEDALAKQFGKESSWLASQFSEMQGWIAEQA